MDLQQAASIFRREGGVTLVRRAVSYYIARASVEASSWVRSLYQSKIRPKVGISSRTEQYNGVTVSPYRVTDPLFPLHLAPNQGGHENPDGYETALVGRLREYVRSGDTVTVVGGGLGVTAVVAAQAAGSEGRVTVYEGAGNMISHLQKTLSENHTPASIALNHGIVGRAMRLDGVANGAPTIPPIALSDCDVLQLDCEGAEVDILSELSIRPPIIIVETHGNTDEVTTILGSLDYEIVTEELAEHGPYAEHCEHNGIKVLTANHHE